MGILFNEVKYYKSESVDFSDSSLNGGGPGDEIVNDTLHSIFPEISATERESGLTRIAKYFVFNESSDRVMKDCIFYIKQDVIPPDRLRLVEATELTHFSFENSVDLLGSGSAIAAGTSIQIENISSISNVAGDLVGRSFLAGGVTLTVASSADDTHIAFNEDINIDIVASSEFSSNDDFDIYEDNEDFASAKKMINSVTMSTISTGTTDISIPISDKSYFESGDSIIILDGYYRAVFRGEVSTVADHATDTNLALITLNKAYTSTVTIPVNQGFVANGAKKTLSPGDGKSFWIELTVSPSDAIDSEIVNQFQLGTHFDDISV